MVGVLQVVGIRLTGQLREQMTPLYLSQHSNHMKSREKEGRTVSTKAIQHFLFAFES